MTDIADVIGWKFSHQPGMATVGGVITAFPGGLPSAEDQAAWTAEYEAFLATVTPEMLQAECERRLALGFSYDFGDERGVHDIGTDAGDMAAWDREVTPMANALVATGDTVTTINIVTNTGPVSVTGLEWQGILLAAGAVRQPIWAAYFTLLASNPIPADYTDDSYWTAS